MKSLKIGTVLSILYSVAFVLFPLWEFLLVPGIIFMWIGFAKMGKINFSIVNKHN